MRVLARTATRRQILTEIVGNDGSIFLVALR
jgi:hypothetical protein